MIPRRLIPRMRAAVARKKVKKPNRYAPYRNGLERDYALVQDERQLVGEIAWWRYEEIGFRLARRTFYYPDFIIGNNDGSIEIHEVKGPFVRDDARAKWKIAAELFPMFRWAWVTRPEAGGWEHEYYP